MNLVEVMEVIGFCDVFLQNALNILHDQLISLFGRNVHY